MHPAVRLRELETRAKRRFGQNFLVEPHVVREIVHAAGLAPGEPVTEIGPGLGVLTRALLDAGAEVTAIELDRDLAAALRVDLPQVRLVEADALRVDFRGTDTVVANLPYNVATVLLERLLAARVRRMVLMFQREVAERLLAAPGDDAYGALSVLVSAEARVSRVLDLPPGAFYPPPKIWSTVLRFDLLPTVLPPGFAAVVKKGFAQRRKTLLNGFRDLGRERAVEVLTAAGIDPGARAETVELERWRRLAEVIAAG